MKIDVAPLAGARIEIYDIYAKRDPDCVAPLAGARIEIFSKAFIEVPFSLSLPSRERGLKYRWNECATGTITSLPSRERGLK